MVAGASIHISDGGGGGTLKFFGALRAQNRNTTERAAKLKIVYIKLGGGG